jgi:hypothetical protein
MSVLKNQPRTSRKERGRGSSAASSSRDAAAVSEVAEVAAVVMEERFSSNGERRNTGEATRGFRGLESDGRSAPTALYRSPPPPHARA